MPAKKYVVTLTEEERLDLERAARSNKRSALERQRARILLRAGDGEKDAAIARALEVSLNAVADARRRFCLGGRAKSVRRAAQRRRRGGARRAGSTAGPRRTWSPWCARDRPPVARPGR